MKFYIPSWSGDVRFESLEGGEHVQVVVHDPTPAETKAVEGLLAFCRGKGWTDLLEIPKPEGRVKRWRKSTFVIKGPLAEVGAEAVRLMRPAQTSITALSFKGGEIHVAEAAKTGDLIQKAEAREKEDPKSDPKAAAVKRPTMSCPQCVPGAVEPASEVLLSFLTPAQHRDWARHRCIEVEGGTTGHRYLVAHRNSANARRWGRICWDADDQFVLHFHDLTHPPEEEVLAAKLFLEHRESWVRNEASCLGHGTDVLKNPFGDWRDGMDAAALMQGLGSALYGRLALREGRDHPTLRALDGLFDADALGRDLAVAIPRLAKFLQTGVMYWNGPGTQPADYGLPQVTIGGQPAQVNA